MWDDVLVRWIPIAFFVFLGLIFVDKALRRGAWRTLAWGRTGGGAPLSRRSHAIWGFAFFAIALVLASAPKPGCIAVAAIAISCVAVIVAGFTDTRAGGRNQAAEEGDDREADSGPPG